MSLDEKAFLIDKNHQTSFRHWIFNPKVWILCIIFAVSPLALFNYKSLKEVILPTDQFSQNALILKIKQGEILGSSRKTRSRSLFFSFQGIPFAQPPIGNLRFKKPQPPLNWEGVRNATQNFNTECLQLFAFAGVANGSTLGEEDCLYLNIFSPQLNGSEPLPVMVWIYGGAFVGGSGGWDMYGPEPFMEGGKIVLVTLNYRVGPFSFFSLDSKEAPGNQGLWDQLAALKWVQENIHVFGGDPNRVTIFGQSSGGFSCSYLIASPLSRGLFHRAILQSGTFPSPVFPWQTKAKSMEYAQSIAQQFGCLSSDVVAVIGCLRNLTAIELNSLKEWTDNDYGSDILPYSFNAIVDGDLLPHNPLELLLNDTPNEIEIIIGTTLNEGLLFSVELLHHPELFELWAENWEYVGPQILLGKSGDGDIEQQHITFANQVMEFYVGSKENFNLENFRKITNMLTDAFLTLAVNKFSDLMAQKGVGVFRYVFDYEPSTVNAAVYNGLNASNPNYIDSHSEDITLLFNPCSGYQLTLTDADAEMSKKMIQMWCEFAANGHPKSEMDEDTWETLESGALNVFLISENSRMSNMASDLSYLQRLEFWETNYPLSYEKDAPLF